MIGAIVIGALAYMTLKKLSADPAYMKNDRGRPTYANSTDNYGGTLFYEEGPIGCGYSRNRRGESEIEANPSPVRVYPVQGGRFVNPGLLAPLKHSRLQGGRFVNPGVGIDYDNAYHFGGRLV